MKGSALFGLDKRRQAQEPPVVKQEVVEAVTQPASKKLEDVQFSIVYERVLHQQLKHAALERDIKMRELVEQLLRKGLTMEHKARRVRSNQEDNIDAFVAGSNEKRSSVQMTDNSVRTVLRMPKDLHIALKAMAIDNHETVRDLVERLLEEGLLEG